MLENLMKDLKNQTFQRSFSFKRENVDLEARTAELSFSSEEPYLRSYWGDSYYEILSHADGAMNMSRLNDGGALLSNHDSKSQIGVVEKAYIEGGKGRAVVRFSRSAEGEKEFQDVIDGIRRNVSVGYKVSEMNLTKTGDKSTPEEWTVSKWEPLEISLVSVPADPSVGVGRSDTSGYERTPDLPIKIVEEKRTMEKTEEQQRAAEEAKKAVLSEKDRVREILAYGRQCELNELAERFVDDGQSVDAFRKSILEKMGAPKQVKLPDTADIGLTKKEIQQFSFLRAINAASNKDWRKAEFEREATQAAAEKFGKEIAPDRFAVPYDVMRSGYDAASQLGDYARIPRLGRDAEILLRTLTTSSPGSNVIATDLLAQDFITLLRNRLAINQVGCTMLTGLVGNIAIPRQNGAGTAYWVADNSAGSESDQSFDQVSMSPKQLTAYTDLSRKLIVQSSIDVEAFVRMDLALIMALAIDLAAINGSGSSNQPLGVLNQTGVGVVYAGASGTSGDNGAAPIWDNLIDLETQVALNNADLGTLAYLTNAKVRGKLKKATKVSNFPMYLWENQGPPVNGYPAAVSNQVPSNLSKNSGSNLSAMIFGNWRDLIVGQWGTLEVLVDPYSNSTTGAVRTVVFQDVDIAVRHPQSFAACVDLITT